MEGVTTAIVGFLFVCVVFPNLVRNKPQYYAALGLVVLILFVQALGIMIAAAAFSRFVGFITALLHVAAILLLIVSCGGVSARDLAGELRHAFEVIRRGEEDKEIIIPRRGETLGPREPLERRRERDAGPAEARLPLE